MSPRHSMNELHDFRTTMGLRLFNFHYYENAIGSLSMNVPRNAKAPFSVPVNVRKRLCKYEARIPL